MSLASRDPFTARRCGAAIRAEAHPSPAVIFIRPVFLHSPLVRCRNPGRRPFLVRPVRAERQSLSRRPACLHRDPIPSAHRGELFPLVRCQVLYRYEAGTMPSRPARNCSDRVELLTIPNRDGMDPAAEHTHSTSGRYIPSCGERRPTSAATQAASLDSWIGHAMPRSCKTLASWLTSLTTAGGAILPLRSQRRMPACA